MDGLFDDLIPKQPAQSSGGGMFDDLLPLQRVPQVSVGAAESVPLGEQITLDPLAYDGPDVDFAAALRGTPAAPKPRAAADTALASMGLGDALALPDRTNPAMHELMQIPRGTFDGAPAMSRRQAADLGVMTPEAPPTTLGQDIYDTALGIREGARNVTSATVGMPVNLLNAINTGFNDSADALAGLFGQTIPADQRVRMMEQPGWVRGIQEGLQLTNEEDAEERASDLLLRQRAQLAGADGAADTLGFLLQNPGALVDVGAQQVGQVLNVIPGAGKAGNIGAGALSAGALNADQVAQELRARNPNMPEQEVQRRAAEVFAASTLANAILPNTLEGASFIERGIGGEIARGQGGLGRQIARGLIGEGVSGAGEEATDQLWQNLALGDPATQGLGQSAVLGALLEGPLGGLAGAGNWLGDRQRPAPQPAPAPAQQVAPQPAAPTPALTPAEPPVAVQTPHGAVPDVAVAPAASTPTASNAVEKTEHLAPAPTTQPTAGDKGEAELAQAQPTNEQAQDAPEGAALRQRWEQDFDAVEREYNALSGEFDSRGGTVLNTDLARELSPEYRGDRSKSADVHEASSDFIKRLYEKKLARPTPAGKDPVVLMTAGGTGAGKTTGERALGDALGNPEIVYDTNMNGLESSDRKIQQALDAGRKVKILYTFRDPVDALVQGALPRAMRMAQEQGTGRTVPLAEHAKTHLGAYSTIKALAAKYQGDDRVEFAFFDNSRGKGNGAFVSFAELPVLEDNHARGHESPRSEARGSRPQDQRGATGARLEGRLREAIDAEHAAGRISDAVYQGFAGQAPRRQVTPADQPRAETSAAPSEPARPAQQPTPPVDQAAADNEPVQQRTTGTKNAVTDAEREAAGRDPILRDAVKSNEATVYEAMRTLKDDPLAGPEAVARLASAGTDGVSLADEAVLLVHKTELLNKREAAAKKLADPDASEAAKEAARQAWTDAEAQIAAVDMAASNAGTEWGRFGQFRQRMMREDFTLAALERKERARLERPLTTEESAKIKAMADSIASLQAQVDKLQARVANAESEGAYEDLVRQMGRQPKTRNRLDALRRAADDARRRLRDNPGVPSRKGQAGAVINPAVFYDLAVIGAYHVANGAANFADWVAAMRADIGARIDQFKADLPGIFKKAKEAAEKPLHAEATVAEVLAKIDRENVGPKDVRKLAEAYIGEGYRGEQAVIGGVAEALGLDESDVRALFVQTDAKREPTMSEAKQELADLRKLVRLQAEIDRLEAGQPKPPAGQKREDSAAVAARKAELADLRKRLRPVRDPEGRYQEMRGKQIEKRIAELQERIAKGDFAPRPRIPRALNEANQRAQYELDKAKEAFLRHQFEDNLRKRSPLGKVFGGVGDVFNLARAVMTSFDLSAVLRQGGFITYGHPIKAMRAFVPSLRAFASDQADHAVRKQIEARKNAPLYKRYGLQLTGIGAGPLTQIEEAYASRWLDRLPTWTGAGLVRGSGRSYTAFLNLLRADAFDAMVAALALRQAPTEAEGKAIANFINAATGRGKLPGASENAAQALNTVFFAPRLVASRFQLLVGQPLYGGTARTRKLIAQEYARFLMGLGVVMGLASFALGAGEDDDDEEKPVIGFDPRSSDFGKIRVGNTYLDSLAGLAQVTVLLSRLATGETVSGSGKVKPLRPGYTLTDLRRALGADIPAHKLTEDGKLAFGSGDAADVLGRFLRTKLAPVPGAIINTLTGTNVIGEEVTPVQAAQELVVPMSFQNVADIMEEHGVAKGTAINLLGILGMGVQHRTTDEARQAKDTLAQVDTAKADIEERLATLPMAQWKSELDAMKKTYAPLLDGVELAYYKKDGKYGSEGEPKRTSTGAPVLTFEGREGVGSVMGELEGYPGYGAKGPYTTEGVQDRVRALGKVNNLLTGEQDMTRDAVLKLTDKYQLLLPAAQALYDDVAAKGSGGEKIDRKTRENIAEQIRFLRSAEKEAGVQIVNEAKGGKVPDYNRAQTLVRQAVERQYGD